MTENLKIQLMHCIAFKPVILRVGLVPGHLTCMCNSYLMYYISLELVKDLLQILISPFNNRMQNGMVEKP